MGGKDCIVETELEVGEVTISTMKENGISVSKNMTKKASEHMQNGTPALGAMYYAVPSIRLYSKALKKSFRTVLYFYCT